MLSLLPMIRSLLTLAAALGASAAYADTLFTNANGVQVDDKGQLSHFSGLLVGDDGKVVRLVRADERQPNASTRIDLHGQTVLPGLIDAHGHVTDLGLSALNLGLVGTASLAELKQRLKDYAAANPDQSWIIGFGWNQELWPDKKFPTAADLDSVVADRPVVLERVDGHAFVVNSAAMRAAGVTAATAAPAGGRVENGLFVDNAKDLIAKAVPVTSPARLDEGLAKAQEILAGYGVTAVGSMSTSLADWQSFQRAGAAGRLNVRLLTYMTASEAAAAKLKPSPWLYGDRLRLIGVKLFADGALGSRGAWLKQPYADKPETRGLQFHSDAEILQQADAAAAAGFQIATHAIGDAGNAQIISTYEKLHAKYPGDRRWRIEHFQIVDPADIPRLKPAGIIASMQPTHETSDWRMAEARLGPDRLKGAYAWQTVEQLGIPLAFGSDFPVENPNPFPGLAAAISREDKDGMPPGGWIPSERLSLAQALGAFTRGAAYAGFAEDRIGSLAPGNWADFIIIDRDVTKVAAKQLSGTQVLETWVGGKRVFSRPSGPVRPERGR